MYPAPPPAEYPPSEQPPEQQQVALKPHRVVLAWVLFGLNFVVYGFAMLRGFTLMGSGNTDVLVLIQLGAKFSPLMDLDGQWWRLLTAMVLHGGLIHLLVNSYALYIIGPEVERIYGTLRFGAMYLVAGLAGSVGSYAFGDVRVPSIGASGAIFGLLGGLGAFAYAARDPLGDIAKRNLRQVAGVAMLNLIIGFSLPGIDNYAHIGGLVVGAFVGLALAPRLRLVRDHWNPHIESRSSPVTGWLWVILVTVAIVALTWVMHRQHLANQLSVLQDYRQAYYQELPSLR